MLRELFVTYCKKIGNLNGVVLDYLVEETKRKRELARICENDAIVILSCECVCDSGICGVIENESVLLICGIACGEIDLVINLCARGIGVRRIGQRTGLVDSLKIGGLNEVNRRNDLLIGRVNGCVTHTNAKILVILGGGVGVEAVILGHKDVINVTSVEVFLRLIEYPI